MARGNSTRLNLLGLRFGRLLVIADGHGTPRHSKWLCRCDCGIEREVFSDALTAGRTRSCGCLRREESIARFTKHGLSKSPEMYTHNMMRQRCHNPKNKAYPYYGGRGIYVCDRWRESFENFLEDMGPRPSPKHSLDRKDNDGPYSPENCRWATKREQMRNRSDNRWLTIAGETKCIGDWEKEAGLNQGIIGSRIRRGWPESEWLKPSTAKRRTVQNSTEN